MPVLSVVVPTFNEAGQIRDLIGELGQALSGHDYEIIVVDDNSPDGTHQRVQEAALENPRVVPVLRVHEKGLATAVIEGMRRATGTYVLVMDSDFQHPPSVTVRMLEAAQAEDADLAVGSRYATGGNVVGFPLVRRVISWGARTMAVIGLPPVRHHRIRDPMSGLFLVRRDRVPLDELKPRGYKILLEVLAKADLSLVIEVGYEFQNRRGGQSKLGIGTQVDYALHVAQLAARDRENRRLLSFGLVGASGVVVHLALLSVLIELYAWDVAGLTQWQGETFYLGTLAAAVVAREVAVLWNFSWNDSITFHDKRRHAHAGFLHRLFRFHVISLWSMLAYLAVFYPLVHLGAHYAVAAIVAVAVGFLLNYAGNVRWTYARRRETHEA